MNRLRVILNLVDDVSSVNYGIWHAAIASSKALFENHGIESWLISPAFDQSFRQEQFPKLKIYKLKSLSEKAAKEFLKSFDPTETLIATHGCWQYPTRWGELARQLGFAWVYTPHGMLEPWSMQQKAWKKYPYFHLFEKRLSRSASLIRAVGIPEQKNLLRHFKQVIHIPNGIYASDLSFAHRQRQDIHQNHFLFLARLHHKKNVLPLAEAWLHSPLAGKAGYLLQIAGTDDGEKAALEQIIEKHPAAGIKFLGPVFGEHKKALMAASDFYILPSLSEGFPTSVVEAAGAGLICLISEGCNFPEILESGLALDTGISQHSIAETLGNAVQLTESRRQEIREGAGHLIETEFIWEKIASRQAAEYEKLLT